MRDGEMTNEQIKHEADKIRELLRGGSIYGWPIDENDADMMLVAAYYAGQRRQEGGHIKPGVYYFVGNRPGEPTRPPIKVIG